MGKNDVSGHGNTVPQRTFASANPRTDSHETDKILLSRGRKPPDCNKKHINSAAEYCIFTKCSYLWNERFAGNGGFIDFAIHKILEKFLTGKVQVQPSHFWLMPVWGIIIGNPCSTAWASCAYTVDGFPEPYVCIGTMPAPLCFPANPKLLKDEKLWYLRGKEYGHGRNIFI